MRALFPQGFFRSGQKIINFLPLVKSEKPISGGGRKHKAHRPRRAKNSMKQAAGKHEKRK